MTAAVSFRPVSTAEAAPVAPAQGEGVSKMGRFWEAVKAGWSTVTAKIAAIFGPLFGAIKEAFTSNPKGAWSIVAIVAVLATALTAIFCKCCCNKAKAA